MSRRAHDYYPTPAWCVRRLLEAVDLPTGKWLEPSAGDGAIIRAVDRTFERLPLQRNRPRWTAVELRPECKEQLSASCPGARIVIGDFLLWSQGLRERWDVAILNPPFANAEDFVRCCLDLANHVAVLERLNWIEGQERSQWFRSNHPDIYVLPERPSFTGEGTDSCAYAWFVWRFDRGRRFGRFQLLNSTNKEERRTPKLVLPDGVGREQGDLF